MIIRLLHPMIFTKLPNPSLLLPFDRKDVLYSPRLRELFPPMRILLISNPQIIELAPHQPRTINLLNPAFSSGLAKRLIIPSFLLILLSMISLSIFVTGRCLCLLNSKLLFYPLVKILVFSSFPLFPSSLSIPFLPSFPPTSLLPYFLPPFLLPSFSLSSFSLPSFLPFHSLPHYFPSSLPSPFLLPYFPLTFPLLPFLPYFSLPSHSLPLPPFLPPSLPLPFPSSLFLPPFSIAFLSILFFLPFPYREIGRASC